jgi:Arc/MetJ-type ribon-helix-helix transcriptional regulator
MLKFSTAAARLDALEEISGEWVGAPHAIREAVRIAEAEAMAAKATTTEDRAWLVTRLERAFENEWSDEAKAPLISALLRN